VTIWPNKHKRTTPSQDQSKSTALGGVWNFAERCILTTGVTVSRLLVWLDFGHQIRFDCPVGAMSLSRLPLKYVVQWQVVPDGILKQCQFKRHNLKTKQQQTSPMTLYASKFDFTFISIYCINCQSLTIEGICLLYYTLHPRFSVYL